MGTYNIKGGTQNDLYMMQQTKVKLKINRISKFSTSCKKVMPMKLQAKAEQGIWRMHGPVEFHDWGKLQFA